MNASEDFTIDTNRPDTAVLVGVLRLASPADYEPRFAPLRQGLERAASRYTLDVSRVIFINSSGITGLSRIVLLARNADKELVIIGTSGIAWQGTTLPMFKRLHKKIEVRMV